MTPTDSDLAASLKCLKKLVPHNWKMPSGKPFPVDKSITRQAFHEGIEHNKRSMMLSQEDVADLNHAKALLDHGKAFEHNLRACIRIIDRLSGGK